MWFRKSALMAHWHLSVFAIDDTLEVLPLKEGGTGYRRNTPAAFTEANGDRQEVR